MGSGGGADDGGEVRGEGAVEVEEVDHRDHQAAPAREAAQQLAEVLRLQLLVLRLRAHAQGLHRQPVLVAQAVAPGAGGEPIETSGRARVGSGSGVRLGRVGAGAAWHRWQMVSVLVANGAPSPPSTFAPAALRASSTLCGTKPGASGSALWKVAPHPGQQPAGTSSSASTKSSGLDALL